MSGSTTCTCDRKSAVYTANPEGHRSNCPARPGADYYRAKLRQILDAKASDCRCGGGYLVLGSTDGHRADCPSHRRSALVTCPHEWTERGTPDDEWRECWLCGVQEDR